jgi:hypothetical protein
MRHAVRAFGPLFLSTILALDASAQRAALTYSPGLESACSVLLIWTRISK